MIKTSLLSVLLMLATVGAQDYSGPKCLGMYCMNRTLSDHTVFNKLGQHPSSAPNLFCYSAPEKGTFMFFETLDTEPHTVADVLVSSFPNCTHMKVHATSANISNWKTPEGIGLGSIEADVLKAYGKPTSMSRVGEIESQGTKSTVVNLEAVCRFVIRGFQKGDKTPKIGDHDLFYRSENMDDPSAAEFGIHNGRVTWIFLSQNE